MGGRAWVWLRSGRVLWVGAGLAAVAVAAGLGGLLLANAGSPDGRTPSAVASPSDQPTSTRTPARPSSPAPRPAEPQHIVYFECGFFERFTVRITDDKPLPDFSRIWADAPEECEADNRRGGDLRQVEQEAYEAGGYDDPDDLLLTYEMCANVDPDDPYVTGVLTATSAETLGELQAALILCPDHPYAAEWVAVAEQGRVDTTLEAEGRLFYNGSFRVGEDVQPGTYYIEGEIEDCYWERQDSAGGIIDNFFSAGARRVEVTIQASDYGFLSEGCEGPWRPVGS